MGVKTLYSFIQELEQIVGDVRDHRTALFKHRLALRRIARALSRAVLEHRINCNLDEIAELAKLAEFDSIEDAAELEDVS